MAQVGSNYEKKLDQKSRWTVPLKQQIYWKLYTYISAYRYVPIYCMSTHNHNKGFSKACGEKRVSTLAGLICPVPTGDLTDAKFSDLSGSGQLIQEWEMYR